MFQSRQAPISAFLLLFFSVSPIAARAAEPPGTSPPALDGASDRRLEQVAPFTIRGEPLAKALRTIGDRTGVKLEAAREVTDLKVTLYARDLTLRRSLEEIAALLDLGWTRRGRAPAYRYECARTQEATLRGREALDKARVANRAAVQAQIARIAQAFRTGNPEALAATDPAVADAITRNDGARRVFEPLTQMPAEVLGILTQTGRITATYDQMPPPAQENLRRMTQDFLPLILGNTRGPDGNSVGFDTFLKSARYTIGVNGLEYGGNNYYAEMAVAGFSMRYGVDLGIPTTPAAGDANASAAGAAGTAPSRPRRPLPPVAAILEGGKSMSVRELSDWLAEHALLAVVSDYYATRYERPLIPMPKAATAEAALAALERYAAVEGTVAEDGRVLRLRSRTWPLDDLMEPPPAAVEALERTLKSAGRLGLTEYLFAAQLTDAQDAGLARIDPAKFGALGGALDGSRPVLKDGLRLLASLTPAQRAAAESSAGLPAAQMTPDQRNLFAPGLMRLRNELRPEDLGAAVFHFRRQDTTMVPGAAPNAAVPPNAPGAVSQERYTFSFDFPGRPTITTSLTLAPAPAAPGGAGGARN